MTPNPTLVYVKMPSVWTTRRPAKLDESGFNSPRGRSFVSKDCCALQYVVPAFIVCKNEIRVNDHLRDKYSLRITRIVSGIVSSNLSLRCFSNTLTISSGNATMIFFITIIPLYTVRYLYKYICIYLWVDNGIW